MGPTWLVGGAHSKLRGGTYFWRMVVVALMSKPLPLSLFSIKTRECEPPGGSRLRRQCLIKQENRTCRNVVGEIATRNMGLLVARVSRKLRLVGGRQACYENIIMVEDRSRASWKLAFETPVFDGTGKSYMPEGGG
jgi:hypothetical protein